jgi:hypothetical protein
VNVNNNKYTCCAKLAGKEETPKWRKKTVTWTNEMIEDLIDFTTRVVVIICIHKLMLIRILSSDWSISIQVPSKLKKK